ncbi:VanZ family protein, partial [bacterium]|nr:VanZ family protein [bacterium]
LKMKKNIITFKVLSVFFMIFILLLTSLPGKTAGNSKLLEIFHFFVMSVYNILFINILPFLIGSFQNIIIINLDKVVHFMLYFILGMLFFKGYGTKKYCLPLLLLFAMLDETHQLFIIGRSFSLLDLFSDQLGIVFVYNLYGL